MKKGFTIIELLLAVALLAVLLVVSGAVFRMATKAYRTAAATGEIARKLRAVTDQLDADFQGLRKDGPIFIAWVPANPSDADGDGDVDTYERFDRIMFFADGDFASYSQGPAGPLVTGDVARITYMLANDNLDRPGVPANRAQAQPAAGRILARSQHIFTGQSQLVDVDPLVPAQCRIRWIDPANIGGPTGVFTQANNNGFEFDNLTLNEWRALPWADARHILNVATDIPVGAPPVPGGLSVNAETPLNVHQLLAEGVGAFSVQGWYEPARRWFPQVDPDGNRDLTDSDFPTTGTPPLINSAVTPHLVYPWPWDLDPASPANSDVVNLGALNGFPLDRINQNRFNRIPGLGRALKFTFTLYDSRGVFKDGKTFTHIVYLDD